MKKKKLLAAIIDGPAQVRFQDLLTIAIWLGFDLVRTRGSHHILIHKPTGAMLNLQSMAGMAKPYQVRQFLKLIEENDIAAPEVDE
jgi:hypothetical protein